MKQCAALSCSPRTITQNPTSAAAQTALARGRSGETQWLIRMESVPGSPSLCWKCYKAQSVILMALTLCNWRKLQASPVLLGSSLHWGMRTLRGWKNSSGSPWLHKSYNLFLARAEREMWPSSLAAMWLEKTTSLSLQLSISIKAAFFLLRKHVTAGGEATRGLCGEGLCLPLQQLRHSQQDFPFRVSVLYGNTPATCAVLPCREVQAATPTTRLQSADTKHDSFLKLKMLSWLLKSSIQLTAAGQPNPKLAVVQQF